MEAQRQSERPGIRLECHKGEDMEKSERITITSFWMDWLLEPVALGAAWLTVRWGLADMSQAAHLATWPTLPTWCVSIPLFLSAAGWLVVGFGMLVKEEVWEFRFIRSGLIVWAVSSLMGALLVLLGILHGHGAFGFAGGLSLVGLVLLSVAILLPAWIDHSSVRKVTRSARVWTGLLVLCVACLVASTLMGFPYLFARFPLAVGAFFLVGLGLTEVAWCKTSFPWFLRVLQTKAGGREYHDAFTESLAWRAEGVIKMVLGIGAAVILIVA
jgi:hypothetical protein